MTEPHVIVENVWKAYRSTFATSRFRPPATARDTRRTMWALRDISLSVTSGEVVAVIGPNGSGKSTLLKCIARIISPEYGRIDVNGRVSALLELGTGFHLELTGRDNIFIAASLLGQSTEGVRRRFDDIVEFSGIAPFIDSPVKNYSSGMYARLAFAVAINVDPDVLLIDEVLAVGDEEFQTRCQDRLYEFRRDGVPVVLVTHDLTSVRNLATRALWLEKGEEKMMGEAHRVVDAYLDNTRRAMTEGDDAHGDGRFGTGLIKISRVDFLDEEGERRSVFSPGGHLAVRIEMESEEAVDDVVVGLTIKTPDGNDLAGITTATHGKRVDVPAGVSSVVYRVGGLPFVPGRYRADVIVLNRSGQTVFDSREGEFGFAVIAGELGESGGVIYPAGRWAGDGLRSR